MKDFKIVVGIDYGRKRIGAAVGQNNTGVARPLSVVKMRQREPDWFELDKIISSWLPNVIVIGKPTTLDGSVHPLNDEIKTFGKNIEKRYGKPVFYVDEYLSSRMATKEKKLTKKIPLDAIAARLILETWFETQKTF